MYIENEETRYWELEARDAHEWRMFISSLCLEIYRTRDRWTPEALTYLGELDRARAIFDGQYHYARARETLAHEDLTLSDMFAA